MRILNFGTTALDQILMMGRTSKGHEGLGYKGGSSGTKDLAPKNSESRRNVHNHKVEKKKQPQNHRKPRWNGHNHKVEKKKQPLNHHKPRRNGHNHNVGKKKQPSRTKQFRCYYCKRLGHM